MISRKHVFCNPQGKCSSSKKLQCVVCTRIGSTFPGVRGSDWREVYKFCVQPQHYVPCNQFGNTTSLAVLPAVARGPASYCEGVRSMANRYTGPKPWKIYNKLCNPISRASLFLNDPAEQQRYTAMRLKWQQGLNQDTMMS